MRKNMVFKIITVCFFLASSFLGINDAKAVSLPPKVKTMITMSVYGSIGGALLGTASVLAFRKNERLIAQGASLGFYAGIIFGGYIIGSYHFKNKVPGEKDGEYYPGAPAGPYGDGDGSTLDGYYQHHQEYKIEYIEEGNRGFDYGIGSSKKSYSPQIYINLLHYTF